MKIKDENKNMSDIGNLLITDKENNPLGKKLDTNKLNLSVNSLKEVDKYLEIVKKNKIKLTEEEIKKIILRTGAYLGEVIRKKDKIRFIWLSHDEASKLGEALSKYDKDILTVFVLYDSNKKYFWFPLAKSYKFIQYGKAESLWAFAKVCLEGIKK
jgi:hypothetical protein